MKASQLAIVASFVSITLASPTLSKRHVQHERRDELSSVWIKRDAVEPERLLPMRIGLTQSNLDRGHDLLMEM